MRFLFLVFFTLIAFPTIACAESAGKDHPSASGQAVPPPEIVIDKESGVIRFMVEGKEMAEINKDGLLVKGNISYSGSITDYQNSQAK